MVAASLIPLAVFLIAQLDAGPAPAAPTPPAEPPAARGDKALFDGKDDAATYRLAIAAYDEAIKAGSADADVYGRQAEAWLRLGDVLSKKDDKRDAYERGRAAAEAGIAKDAKCGRCYMWRGATIGRWGELKGVLNALFLLDDVKKSFETAYKLNPQLLGAKLSLGKIDEAVPGFAGGSKERAEQIFRDVIKADPHFTRAKLDLAELLLNDDDDNAEAKTLIQQVIDEKTPRSRGEHRKFDLPRARALLKR